MSFADESYIFNGKKRKDSWVAAEMICAQKANMCPSGTDERERNES